MTTSTDADIVQQSWVHAFVSSQKPMSHSGEFSDNDMLFEFPVRARYDQKASRLKYIDCSENSFTAQEKSWYRVIDQARCDTLAALDYKGIAVNLLCAIQANPSKSIASTLYRCSLCIFWRSIPTLHSMMEKNHSLTALHLELLPSSAPETLFDASSKLHEPDDTRAAVTELVVGLAKVYGPCCGQARQSADSAESHENELLAEYQHDPEAQNPVIFNDEFEEENSLLTINDADHTIAFGTQDSPANDYQIFNTSLDEILDASDIATLEDKDNFYKLRSTSNRSEHRLIQRIAHRLLRKIKIAQQRMWRYDQERGSLDPSRLTRLVTRQEAYDVFRDETDSPIPTSVVSLLVDHSGSMQGDRLNMALTCIDIIIAVLESCQIRCELLGFTTRYWADNPLVDNWQKSKRMNTPGRLNALKHIVYKGADSPWRHTAANAGVMLRQEFGRENIDGEALLWACERLSRRHERNKILLVLSDGAPMDEATSSSNPGDILSDHLRSVIQTIESQGQPRLAAIGIAHEVSRYYSNAIEIAQESQIATALEDGLSDLLLGSHV